MPARLEARLVSARQYKSDQPVDVTFELANSGDEDAYVLTWYTPLEGLWSDCLRVTRDGEPVPYDGPLAKRGEPTEEDYVRVPAGESVTADVELSRAYQVTEPGTYDVAVDTRLADVTSEGERAFKGRLREEVGTPRKLESPPATFEVQRGENRRATFGEAMRLLESDANVLEAGLFMKGLLGGGPVAKAAAPKFNGGTAQQQAAVSQAHDDGYDLVIDALASLANDAQYKEWFGTHTSARLDKVKNSYEKIKSRMDSTTFTYDLTGTGCKPRTYAYTYKGGTTIWMCDLFWTAPAMGTDSKAGTVVHEHSHASARTDDIVYGQAKARNLASTDPDKAIINADNYEYYAKG